MRKNCETCKHNDEDSLFDLPCKECEHTSDAPTKWEPATHYEPDTNADRIRAMSDEEFAEVLGKLVHCGGCPMRDNCKVDDLPCNNVLLEWLKQPAEEMP